MSEREQFEAWWACTMPEQYQADAMRLLKQSRNGDGKYGLIRVQDQWESWQASRRAALEEIGMILTDSSRAHLAVRINDAMELIDGALDNGDVK